MKNTQTAVEWLEQQLYKSSWDEMTHEERMNICCTAKLMEREYIEEAYDVGYHSSNINSIMNSEEYYEQTFKSE
jgi:hypothetical protein